MPNTWTQNYYHMVFSTKRPEPCRTTFADAFMQILRAHGEDAVVGGAFLEA